MTAQTDETSTETAMATGSPAGRLSPGRALEIWRAIEASAPNPMHVGMLWASKPADVETDAEHPPRHGEGRWLAALLPPAAALAGSEVFGGLPAAAWCPVAGLAPRLLVWSYRSTGARRPALLDVEVHEAVELFGTWAPIVRWVFGAEGDAALDAQAMSSGWRRVDDWAVRSLVHRLSVVVYGDAIARPLRA